MTVGEGVWLTREAAVAVRHPQKGGARETTLALLRDRGGELLLLSEAALPIDANSLMLDEIFKMTTFLVA